MGQFIRFFKDAYEELKRVTWLSRKQMVASTFLVLVLVLIMSVYVFLVDQVIERLFRLII